MMFFFFVFVFFCVLKCLFCTVFFEHQPNCSKKVANNDNFLHFAKHRLLKNVLLKSCFFFFYLSFVKEKIDVEQETQLKIRKETKIRRRDLKNKTGQETKETEMKNKQKYPFLGENRFCCFLKKRKEKNNKKQSSQNKEGLGPSEVVLWATSPGP